MAKPRQLKAFGFKPDKPTPAGKRQPNATIHQGPMPSPLNLDDVGKRKPTNDRTKPAAKKAR
jgi:hypothetical protein